MKGNNAVFSGPCFDAALKILFLKIDLNGFVGGNAETAVNHDKHDAGGRILLVFPELIDVLLCERFSFFNIVFLTNCYKLRVIFFDNIVLHGILVHLAVQFFYVGKA